MGSLKRREFIKGAGRSAMVLPLAPALASSVSADDSSSKQRIKVGQIGVGHAHASKLAVYRRSGDYDVVGVVEPDAKLRAEAQGKGVYRDLPWMTQEQLLNVPKLQTVLVETRVRDSLNAAEACVAAGKHIHLDKPAGRSLPQFQRILQAAAKRNVLVQMGYMYRYNPAIVMLRDFLKQGWLGEPFEAHAVMSKVIGPDKRRRLAQHPGGTMFELGCHLIDLIVGLLGKPEGVHAFPRHSSRLDDKLVDNMLAVFTYPRATVTVRSSALEVEGFARRHLVVCGTGGTFHVQPLDNPAARVALSQARGKYGKGYQDVAFPKYTRYVADAADMAKIIRGQKKADFSYDHDLAVQETIMKASGLT